MGINFLGPSSNFANVTGADAKILQNYRSKSRVDILKYENDFIKLIKFTQG